MYTMIDSCKTGWTIYEKREIKVVGIDLGKTSFHLHAVDDRGHTQMTKKQTRNQLKATMSNLSPCLVGIEACAGAHDWARRLSGYGHEVGTLIDTL